MSALAARPGRLLLILSAVVVAVAGAVIFTETPADRPAFIDRLEFPLDYGELVRTHAARNRLDAALVAAVIYEESRFRAHARSSVGAMGLMQIQPVTAQTIARRTGGTRFRVSDLYAPDVNIRYGTWYLRRLLDKYGDERLALAAYNAGETAVDRWLAEGRGIAAADVRTYVDKVENTKKVYRHAYGADLPTN
jgi:soluble lytic murein transglycosylase